MLGSSRVIDVHDTTVNGQSLMAGGLDRFDLVMDQLFLNLLAAVALVDAL